ncbi:MAG TPA: hypothetical protein VGF95_01240 [Solirubrobacteraceae bacterium]|jgi:hypothetical protein
MLTAIFTTALIVLAIAVAIRNPQEERLIKRRPYNNRYSDASAARDGHL